jgi:hypothetical protein
MSAYTSEENEKYKSLPPLPDFRNIDINKIRSPNRSGGPEYIPYNKRGRDFYGRLSFNTGVFWLGGFAAGSARGVAEGLRQAPGASYKILFNSVMNGISKRGSTLGSSLGIIGM